jgi:hypothetical protein
MINKHLYKKNRKFIIAMKQSQLIISISTINDTDYFEKGISIYFFCYNFQIVVQVFSVFVFAFDNFKITFYLYPKPFCTPPITRKYHLHPLSKIPQLPSSNGSDVLNIQATSTVLRKLFLRCHTAMTSSRTV